MDGLDFQPARRLERPREELACRDQSPAVRRSRSRRDNLADQFVIGQLRPAGELIEDTRSHIRGRCLGEGQAKNFRGRDALQEKPDDPAREHISLARSGIGGNPDGLVWVRGVVLLAERFWGNSEACH